MRLLPVAIAALIAVSSVSTPSTAKAEDLLAASICDYVKSNDKNCLRKKLKENRVKLRNIYSGLSCDGESLLRTAYHSNAEDTGEFIAKRLSKTELEVVEADGKTIVDWADANGFGASIITLAIQDRLGS